MGSKSAGRSKTDWFGVGLLATLSCLLSWGSMWLGDKVLPAPEQGGGFPLGMMLPAAAAIVLQVLVLRRSPLHYSAYRARPRWILLSYLAFTGLGVLLVLSPLVPGIPPPALRLLTNFAMPLWLLAVLFIYRRSSRSELSRAGLQLGRIRPAILLLAGFILFLLLQPLLNLVFRLGSPVAMPQEISGVQLTAGMYGAVVAITFLLTLVAPLGNMVLTFGEEYAWRGYLLEQLGRTDRRVAALGIGLFWGFWHWPVIMSGVHTYKPTAAGFALALMFFTLWGVVQAYAAIKTRSIWVPAFLHGTVNSLYAFTLSYMVRPGDMFFSFGLGLYGVICLGAVVAVILFDPVWRLRDSIFFAEDESESVATGSLRADAHVGS